MKVKAKLFFLCILFITNLGMSMDFDDCILKYAKEAKTKGATTLVHQSCNFLNLKINKKWSKCILNNVPDAHTKGAVTLIFQSCSKKYPKSG